MTKTTDLEMQLTREATIIIPGRPATKGSGIAIIPNHQKTRFADALRERIRETKRIPTVDEIVEHLRAKITPIVIQDSKRLRGWTKTARSQIRKTWHGPPIPRGRPVTVLIDLIFEPAERSTFEDMVVTPDMDKVERAILDALQGIVYENDAQVAMKSTLKRYGRETLVVITVFEGIVGRSKATAERLEQAVTAARTSSGPF